MSQRIIQNWLQLAEYDMSTAEAMYKEKRYLYVAFTCQQAIEKVLKALFIKEKGTTPPYTHNLMRLVDEINLKNEISEEQIACVENLNSYYIESRYTEEITIMFNNMDNKTAKLLLDNIKELYTWMIKKI